MFLTKRSLSRRTLLRGMGAAVALPLLDSMSPAASAPVAVPKRFGVIFVPLGERPGYWTPAKTGADFEFTPILKPLEPFRKSLTVVSELCDPLDVHAGTTIDQVIAKQIGGETVYPSLELATEDFTGYIGGCDPAYACAYMNTLSWRTPTEPLPMEINPRVVFERMFGRPGTAAQRLQRMQTDHSILDSIKEDLSDLGRGLDARDRARIDDYLENVREVEQRIQRAEKQAKTEVQVPDAPVGIPESFEEHVALQFDLLALAWQADITRVFTFMMSRDATQRV